MDNNSKKKKVMWEWQGLSILKAAFPNFLKFVRKWSARMVVILNIEYIVSFQQALVLGMGNYFFPLTVSK